MAIKMRVLYWSNKAKMRTIANLIKNEFELTMNAVDVIPPAYSCDKERIVILCISIKEEPEDQLRLFCNGLNKQRAQNVALIIDGNEKGAKYIKDMVRQAGTNLIDDVLFVKGGLPFLSKLSDEEKKTIIEWAHRIVDNLQ
ncbi:MAG: hypothetical protein GX057_02615 [Clostridiales bacterium]|nr:hypothetical protein [Clostridiales bacterium]